MHRLVRMALIYNIDKFFQLALVTAAAEHEKKVQERARQLDTVQKSAEDRAWKYAKEAYQEAVKAWEAETMKLKEAKVPKKNWSAKPKCAHKNIVITAMKPLELTGNS